MPPMQAWLRYSLLAATTVAGSAHWIPGTDETPAFYTVAPPAGKPILHGDQLSGPFFSHPFQVTAYEMAAKIGPVLYAEPCYCRCDRALRHKSLHSCFEGTHGAICGTCLRQAVFAYQQTRLGKSPEEIRTAIEHGDAQAVRLEDAAL